ncbi:MAG: hypothetical protein ACI9U2_004208 [Bradymonadia bacterium]|jgi:hypothetical protein
MSTPVRFAGIDDYRAFDASLGQPKGTSDLRGGPRRTKAKTRQISNGHPVLAACRATALSSEINFGDTYFDAFSCYCLYDDNETHVISTLATGPNYASLQGYLANMGYWQLTTSAVSELKSAGKIQFKNHHTATSTFSKPTSNGFSSLGGQDYTLPTQTFVATTSNQSFGFDRLFEREDGGGAMGFIWDGGNIKAINWFHKSSTLVFTSGSNTGSLSDSHFYASSDFNIHQVF